MLGSFDFLRCPDNEPIKPKDMWDLFPLHASGNRVLVTDDVLDGMLSTLQRRYFSQSAVRILPLLYYREWTLYEAGTLSSSTLPVTSLGSFIAPFYTPAPHWLLVYVEVTEVDPADSRSVDVIIRLYDSLRNDTARILQKRVRDFVAYVLENVSSFIVDSVALSDGPCDQQTDSYSCSFRTVLNAVRIFHNNDTTFDLPIHGAAPSSVFPAVLATIMASDATRLSQFNELHIWVHCHLKSSLTNYHKQILLHK